MIPKADGDSTPLGQRTLSVPPVVYRIWASLRLGIFGSGFWGGCLVQYLVLVTGFLRLKPGFLLHWILRRFCLGLEEEGREGEC